ncbi:MAG: thiolase C-terminal domain-containing protein [Dehalococcoidia bacterium]
MSTKNAVAIVGAAETDTIGVIPDKSAIQLHAEAARNALNDAGLKLHDVDGILCAGQSPVAMANYLGIVPSFLDGTSVGGCSFMIHVRHAVAAILAGYCQVALVTHGESGRSGVGGGRDRAPSGGADIPSQFESPFGPFGPPTLFPMGVARYMKTYGLTEEQLAMVAVQQRKWAAMNPRAMMREPIGVEDVMNSRLISWPVHLLECCLVTDGGGALVLVAADRARSMGTPKQPVYIMGSGESCETPIVSQMADFTSSAAFRVSGANAFKSAGIEHKDVDHLMIYDAFAHLPIYGLEDLGFVQRGKAGAFIADGRTAPGGGLPLNTNGGGLSYTHTGMYGMFAIQESVRQVRGEAPAQVPNVQISIAHGVGGMFAASGTLVLTNEP